MRPAGWSRHFSPIDSGCIGLAEIRIGFVFKNFFNSARDVSEPLYPPPRLVGMSPASLPYIIRVTVNKDPGGVLVALSPDVPGVLAVALDARRLSVSIPERIRAWFQAEGQDVHVVWQEGRMTTLSTWKIESVEAKTRGLNSPFLPRGPVTSVPSVPG